MSKKRRVLVTGASGFIGRYVIEHFLEETDWDLILIDNLSYATDVNGLLSSLKRVEAGLERTTLLYHDLNAPLEGAIMDRIGDVDFIVNAASASHVERSISGPVNFIQNNVSLSINMLEFARRVRPEKYVQVSTDEVYGPAPTGCSHSEWATIVPSNPYAASKAAQEAISIAYWRTYGVPVIITNTMNNFGESQHPEKFIPMVVRKILARQKITIHGSFDNEGNFVSGSRVWLHAINHAHAIRHILEGVPVNAYPDQDRPTKIHISGEKEVSNLDIVNLASEILEIDAITEPVDFNQSRPGHDLRYSLDGSLLRETLNWTPLRDFDRSFRETVLAIRDAYVARK